MKTKHSTKFIRAILLGLSLAPALALAHPGHSAFDAAAGMPHPGHEAEYFVIAGLIALPILAAVRAFLKRRS